MTTEFACDVFLSHNAADKPRVRRLAEPLRAARFNFVPRTSHLGLPRAGRRFIPFRLADFNLSDTLRGRRFTEPGAEPTRGGRLPATHGH